MPHLDPLYPPARLSCPFNTPNGPWALWEGWPVSFHIQIFTGTLWDVCVDSWATTRVVCLQETFAEMHPENKELEPLRFVISQ